MRHLSPHGGGGDRGSSDVRHPGLFLICFYPIRVRVTHWQLGSDTNVKIIVYLSVTVDPGKPPRLCVVAP